MCSANLLMQPGSCSRTFVSKMKDFVPTGVADWRWLVTDFRFRGAEAARMAGGEPRSRGLKSVVAVAEVWSSRSMVRLCG